jgi:hypothetical protein
VPELKRIGPDTLTAFEVGGPQTHASK